MFARAVIVLMMVGLGAPVVVVAQGQPAPSSDIELRVRRERPIVLPRPPAETAVQDTEAVRQEIQARDRALLRDARERAQRRPDLDRSVVDGIQTQRLQRALGR